jgi:cysteine dioxygenase
MNHPTRHLSLTDLVESLKGKVAAIPRSHVTEAVQRLIVTDQEIAEQGSFRDHRYSRNLVFRDQRFEILILCWKSGQRSLIHDHGGSFGVVKVLRGVLTESLFVPALNGMIKPERSTDYRVGDVQIEEPSTIHQVSNLQPERCDAVSLHVYLPPLRAMSIYRLYDVDIRSVSAELYNYGGGI